MQIGSRRMRLVVTGATIAWLIGVAFAISGTGMSTRGGGGFPQVIRIRKQSRVRFGRQLRR